MNTIYRRIDEWKYKNKNIALIFKNGENITYSQLKKEIDIQIQLIKDFEKDNKINNQVIALPMSRTLSAVAKLFAIIKLNKIFVPLASDIEIQKYSTIGNQFHLSLFWDEEGKLHQVNGDAEKYEFPVKTLFIGFTSGTTGQQKGFVRDHESWVETFQAFEEQNFPFRAKHVACLSPLNYSLGLYVLCQSLYLGQSFLMDNADFKDVLALNLDKTEMYGVPSILRINFLKNSNISQQNFRLFLSGEPVNQDLRDDFYLRFPKAELVDFYGTSEASFIAMNRKKKPEINESGIIFPNVTVDIENAKDGIGEIFIKSPMSFMGYYNKGIFKEAKQPIFTGDLGFVKNNSIYNVGRIDSRINRGGEKIFPKYLEALLIEHPAIKDILIVGQEDLILGQKVKAYIIFSKDNRLSIDQINKYLKQKAKRKSVIDSISEVEEFSINPSGKRSLKIEQVD